MFNKGRISCEYKVTLSYRGLTAEELYKLSKLLVDENLPFSSECDHLNNLNIGKDYDRDYDSLEESTRTYNFTLVVDKCGGIAKEAWMMFHGNEVLEGFDDAERIRQFIKDKTGIE